MLPRPLLSPDIMAAPDADLIDRFLEMMAAERGVAKNTISAYQSDLAAASRLTAGGLTDADAATLRKLAKTRAAQRRL